MCNIVYEVRVIEYPKNHDIMFGLSFSKSFPSFEFAKECQNIWKEQFDLDSKIVKCSYEEL